jgi:hypothetical protein
MRTMADVFISFIHEEQEVAEAVQRFIKGVLNINPFDSIGHKAVFMSSDQWAIHAGEMWLDRIITELREAKVVVSLLSSKSVTRPWVNFEAGAAWVKEDTALIPVCFGGLSKGTLPKPYSSLQALDLDDEDDQYYLITSVCHYLKRMAPPPFYRGESDSPEIDKIKKPFRELREALKRALLPKT